MRLKSVLIGLILLVSIAAIPVLRETGLWDEWFGSPTPAPIASIDEPQSPPAGLNDLTRRMQAAVRAQDPSTAGEGAAPEPAPAQRSGRIRLLFKLGELGAVKMTSDEYNAWMRIAREEKLFNAATDLTNDLIALDRDLIATFQECDGTVNAWFDPSRRTITFCYEVIAQFAELFAPYAETREDLVFALRGAALFVYLHEIGHAMVQEMRIPITGNEEVAVDQFATMLLLQLGEEGERAVLAAADNFQLSAAQARADGRRVVLWDEHPLDEQRFYNLACWIFGADPYRNVHLVARGALPERRAGRCGGEYQQMRDSWKELLDPKLKHPLQ